MGKAAFDRHAGEQWTRSDEVIYQVYPRSFKDANGDGHGDIQGITQQLDYIAGLGVDAIWISPIYLSPDGPAGDGGYAVECHRTINPQYGTMDDFDNMVQQAEKRGLKIYMDFVLPHTSNTHAWFEKSRDPQHPEHEKYKDYYVWHPGHVTVGDKCMNADEARKMAARGEIEMPAGQPGMPNNWKSVFGGPAWSYDDKRKAFYMHHFFDSQPAVNLNRIDVQDALFDDMEFWRQKGVRGLRLDSVSYANYNPDFKDDHWMRGYYPYEGQGWDDQYLSNSMCQDSTKELITRMRQRFPYMKLIGEVIAGRKGGRESMELADGYVEAGLDCCYTTYERAIGSSSPDYMRGMLGHFEQKFPGGGLMYTISDHDGYEESPRAYTRITRNVPNEHKETAYRQALQLYASLHGTLSIYQGDELGLSHARIPEDIAEDKIQDHIAHTKGMKFCRDGARTPFPSSMLQKNAGFSTSATPYLPVPQDHYLRAVDMQENDPESTLNFTRDLIRWRKEQPALKDGKTRVLGTDGALLAFLREDRDQTILCAFNMGSEKFYFKPGDVLDAQTLADVGLTKDDVFVMHPYGYEFAGETGPDHSKRRAYIPVAEREPAPDHQHDPRLVAA